MPSGPSDITFAVGDGVRQMTYVELAADRGISAMSAERGSVTKGRLMATETAPLIGPSQSRFAGDVLWLGFTGFVFALILLIVCWPLSVELPVHNPPGAAAGKPTFGLTSEANTRSASAAPLPALARGDRITRADALLTPSGDVGEETSNVAPPSAIATLGEPAGDSLMPPDRAPQVAQSASAPAAVSSPGTHRLPQHKPRARPVAAKEPPQLTPR